MTIFTGNLLERPNDVALPADRFPTRYLAGWGIEWDFYWNGNAQSFTSWNTEWGIDWSSITSGYYLRKNKLNEFQSETRHGSFLDRQPYLTIRRNIVGHLSGAFSDQFYNRIVVEPSFIDFGSLTGDATEDVVVWNAYFENKILSEINENNFDSGLLFSGEDLPKTYLALEEETYSVNASLDGPITIDALLGFVFTSEEEKFVSITGSRIVFLPIMYRDGMVEQLEWDTDILNSYNGTEQRVKNRTAPRQFLTVQGFIQNTVVMNLENLLYGWRDKYWAIPIWQDMRVGSDIVAGSSIINVDTTNGDFRIDSLVGIWKDQSTFDIINVIEKTDNTLSFDRSINTDFTSPLIFPVRLARMSANPVRKTNGYSSILSTKLQVTDNIALETSASVVQYNDIDVFLEVPEMPSGSTIDDTYEKRIDLLDYSTGNIEQTSPWNNIRINRSFTFVKEGLEEIWDFRLWLHRRCGKLRPFWMPTYEKNMDVITTTYIADNFYIEPDSYATQAVNRTNIIVFMKDGTYVMSEIVAVNTDDATQTKISVSPELSLSGADIEYVSFLGLKRLASDKISIKWHQNNVAVFTVPIKEISP